MASVCSELCGVEELRVLKGRGSGAGDEVEQGLEVAIGAEREVGDLAAFDLGTDVGAIGLEQRGRGGDEDGLVDAAGGEVDIDAGGGVVEEDDVLVRLLLKARGADGDAVGARRKIGHGVVAALVGARYVNRTGGCFRGRDFGIGNCRAAGIVTVPSSVPFTACAKSTWEKPSTESASRNLERGFMTRRGII